eukprot:15477992-Alexandrium_andersonii.AAC.1
MLLAKPILTAGASEGAGFVRIWFRLGVRRESAPPPRAEHRSLPAGEPRWSSFSGPNISSPLWATWPFRGS